MTRWRAINAGWLALSAGYVLIGVWVFLWLADMHTNQARHLSPYQPAESCDWESSAGCVRHDYRMSWVIFWLLVGATVAGFNWWSRRYFSEHSL
jgi:hypothetical protein